MCYILSAWRDHDNARLSTAGIVNKGLQPLDVKVVEEQVRPHGRSSAWSARFGFLAIMTRLIPVRVRISRRDNHNSLEDWNCKLLE